MKQYIKHKSIAVYANGNGSHAIHLSGESEVYPFPDDNYTKSVEQLLEGITYIGEPLSSYKDRAPDSVKILTVKFK